MVDFKCNTNKGIIHSILKNFSKCRFDVIARDGHIEDRFITKLLSGVGSTLYFYH